MVEESMINATETPAAGFHPTNVSNLGIQTEYIVPLFFFSLAGVAFFVAIGIFCNNQSKKYSTEPGVNATLVFAPFPPPSPPSSSSSVTA